MEITLAEDFIYGAIASMGFATISNPPLKALPFCGIIAGIGHCVRFLLMQMEIGIVTASLVAAMAIGCLAVFLSKVAKCPAECLSYPALLPMIPGMYAYKMVLGLIGCLQTDNEKAFLHNFFLFGHNMITTFAVIIIMVAGITMPIFILNKISFTATKKQG